MIDWETEAFKDGSKRRFYGVSQADSAETLTRDFTGLWLKLFSDQLVWYPADSWNSLIAAVQPWHGTVDVELSVDCSIDRQLPGVGLYFEAMHDNLEDAESDEQYDRRASQFLNSCVTAIESGFRSVADTPAVRQVLDSRSIRLDVLVEPDEPPVLSLTLQ
jgi:hypothetical protein